MSHIRIKPVEFTALIDGAGLYIEDVAEKTGLNLDLLEQLSTDGGRVTQETASLLEDAIGEPLTQHEATTLCSADTKAGNPCGNHRLQGQMLCRVHAIDERVGCTISEDIRRHEATDASVDEKPSPEVESPADAVARINALIERQVGLEIASQLEREPRLQRLDLALSEADERIGSLLAGMASIHEAMKQATAEFDQAIDNHVAVAINAQLPIRLEWGLQIEELRQRLAQTAARLDLTAEALALADERIMALEGLPEDPEPHGLALIRAHLRSIDDRLRDHQRAAHLATSDPALTCITDLGDILASGGRVPTSQEIHALVALAAELRQWRSSHHEDT